MKKNDQCSKCKCYLNVQNLREFVETKDGKRYCFNEHCAPFDAILERLGYTLLSDKTWDNHCKTCETHQIPGCGDFQPQESSFFNKIVFTKRIKVGHTFLIIEVGRPDFSNHNDNSGILPDICLYEAAIVFSSGCTVQRIKWQLLDKFRFIEFIRMCEDNAESYRRMAAKHVSWHLKHHKDFELTDKI